MNKLKEYSNRLYRQAGRFNLYFHFNCVERGFDRKRLKAELECIKKIVLEIENEMERL